LEELSFEEAFAQLEAAVAALQDGKLPLERALQYYQEGMKLAQ
jgi:exodeoxyribonuclease VII small subunit